MYVFRKATDKFIRYIGILDMFSYDVVFHLNKRNILITLITLDRTNDALLLLHPYSDCCVPLLLAHLPLLHSGWLGGVVWSDWL